MCMQEFHKRLYNTPTIPHDSPLVNLIVIKLINMQDGPCTHGNYVRNGSVYLYQVKKLLFLKCLS